MSWFYRKFTKSDDDGTVTLTSDTIQLTGAVTVTGALTQTGNVGITGTQTVSSYQTVSGTARHIGSIYLGTGTQAIVFGTSGVDPINTGVSGSYDKGSIFMGGTANLYYKTDYASTSWASVDAVD